MKTLKKVTKNMSRRLLVTLKKRSSGISTPEVRLSTDPQLQKSVQIEAYRPNLRGMIDEIIGEL